MAQQPVGLFALKLLPGEEHDLDVFGDVRITNVSFGETLNGTGRTVVRVHHRPVPSFYDDDEDEDDEDDDDEDDDEDDEDDEEDEEEDEEEETKVNGKGKKADSKISSKLNGILDEAEEADEGDEDDEEEEEETFVICSLYPKQLEQVTVDLHFSTEDQVRFSISGDNPVEILGCYLSPGQFDNDPDDDEIYDDLDDDDDEEIDSDELEMLEADSDDDEEDDEDQSVDFDEEFDDDEDDEDDDIVIGEIEVEEDDDDEDDEEDDDQLVEIDDDESEVELAPASKSKKRSAAEVESDEDEADVSAPVTDAQLAKEAKALGVDISKLTKNQRKKLNKRLRAAEDASGDLSMASSSKADVSQDKVPAAKGKAAKDDASAAQQGRKKVTLPSGVIVEDVKVGKGAAAKAGNRLSMRYVGRLQNGKQFDANTKGKPFTFKLGKGDVIGGWDQGLKGMQVGGERRLVIPPKMGYGARGAPPDIPGNATLVFDVKLVEIK